MIPMNVVHLYGWGVSHYWVEDPSYFAGAIALYQPKNKTAQRGDIKSFTVTSSLKLCYSDSFKLRMIMISLDLSRNVIRG